MGSSVLIVSGTQCTHCKRNPCVLLVHCMGPTVVLSRFELLPIPAVLLIILLIFLKPGNVEILYRSFPGLGGGRSEILPSVECQRDPVLKYWHFPLQCGRGLLIFRASLNTLALRKHAPFALLSLPLLQFFLNLIVIFVR